MCNMEDSFFLGFAGSPLHEMEKRQFLTYTKNGQYFELQEKEKEKSLPSIKHIIVMQFTKLTSGCGTID